MSRIKNCVLVAGLFVAAMFAFNASATTAEAGDYRWGHHHAHTSYYGGYYRPVHVYRSSYYAPVYHAPVYGHGYGHGYGYGYGCGY